MTAKLSLTTSGRGFFLGTLAFCLAAAQQALGDHGPGTSGGGVTTQPAETLKPGKFSVDLRSDYTEFERLSTGQIANKAAESGDFDVLDRSLLNTFTLSYGIVENFQASLTLGHYLAENAREARFNPSTGETEFSSFNPDGLTDLWLSGKYRFYRGPLGQFALLGGVKFPTGRHHIKDSSGEQVDLAATAGSGAFDGLLGLAHSRWLTARMTLDSHVQYILRGGHDDFKVGDRFDASFALAYRLTEGIEKFPQVSVFTETSVRHLFKSEEHGVPDPNSDGMTFFLSPGLRAGFGPQAALTVSPQIPIIRNWHGESLKTHLKVLATLTLTF